MLPHPCRPTAGKADAWIHQYGWTAYCLPPPFPQMSQSMCGKCLRLTNQRTGAVTIARIVDL